MALHSRVATFPQSRFVAIAQVGINQGAPNATFATVREPIPGGASILEAWPTDGGVVGTPRRIEWDGGMRVQALASNVTVTAIAGPSSLSDPPPLVLEHVSMPDFVPTSFATIEGNVGPSGRVARLRMLNVGVAPALAFTDGKDPDVARLIRPTTMTFGLQLLAAGALGTAIADDVVEAPFGAFQNRIMMTGRCNGGCTFASQPGPNLGVLVGRLGWTTYEPGSPALNSAPGGSFLTLADAGVPSFNTSFPIRLAFDGLNFVYVAGQVGSALIIERRAVADGAVQSVFSSTGPLTLVDFIRGPSAGSVIALARVSTSGVSWSGGQPFPLTPTSGPNVVVIRIDASRGTAAIAFDVPGDQQPVALAHGGDGQLAIVLNEGTTAIFWRAPIP